jgi:4,5-dihydroxyphthalate decarboxylase
MTDVALTLGFNPAPNTNALIDGSVGPQGIELRVQTEFGDGFDNIGARHRSIISGETAGGELSISSFVLARYRGVKLKALPVFLSRRFRFRSMYCRVDASLRDPSELRGKKVTVHRYNSSTAVWLRGILQNEYKVDPQELEWLVAEPDIAEESLHPPPAEVRVSFISPPRTREHAIELVEQGEIDAALEPYAALSSNPRLRHVVGDYRKAEQEFFQRTGAYTVNHLFALREDIAEAHPWIPESLLTAFRAAEAAAERYRSAQEKNEAAWEKKIMGEPFWYSLNRGCARKSIETLIEYQVQQGILDEKPETESLFFPQVLKL